MQFTVRLFADGTLIEPSQYPQVVITSKAIDRIVNHVFALANETNDGETEVASA